MSNWTGYANRLAVGCDLDLNRNPTHDDPNVAVILHTYAATNYDYYNYDVTLSHSGDFGSGSTTRRMVNSQAQEFDGWNSWVTAQYGATQYLVLNLSASGSGAGPVSGSWGITIPARPYGAPAAPAVFAASRVSDTQVNLSWTNKPTTGEPYSNILVEWREESPVGSWTAWKQFTSLSGSATSYQDRATGPNHRYQYRIRASNSAGYSGYTAAAEVVTTPGAPTGVGAVKNADSSITVTWASGAPYSPSSWVILDNGVQVGTAAAGVFSWTHATPDPAVTHTYTVRMVAPGGLTSAESAPSPTIQLLAAPSAPTLVSPSGVTAPSETAVTLRWAHNAVDSTAQTSAQVRYRAQGATSWTTVTATTSQQVSVGVLAVGSWEWQARTRGLYKPTEEAGYSPWSAVTAFATAATPQVVILTPANASTVNTSTLAVTWSYYQAASHAQVSWEVELDDAGGLVLETRTGTGATLSATLATRVLDGASYRVRLRARSSDGLWSEWTSASVSVSYPQPVAPSLAVSWDEDTGMAVIQITNPAPLDPAAATRTNLQKTPRSTASQAVVSLVSDLAGWGGATASRSQVADVSAPSGGGFVTRLTKAQAATSGLGWLWYAATDRPTVTPNLPYALSVFVRASFTVQARIIATWKDSGGTTIRTDNGTLFSLPAGEWARLGAVFTAPTGAANVVMSVGVTAGSAIPAGATVDSDAALTEQATQVGEWFDGSAGPNRVVDGQSYGLAWTGTPNTSTSTMTPNSPPALTNTVERSVDEGQSWEPVADNIPLNSVITDPECLIGAQTLYRVTAISSLPSSAATVVPFTADSRAMWLTAGPGFRQVVRLPYNPSISISPGLVERTVQHFAGRTLGTEMAGTARSRTITIGSLLIEADPTSESSTSADAEDLAYAPAPILYRDPTGRRIYTSLSSLSVKRSHLLRWELNATLEEVGR